MSVVLILVAMVASALIKWETTFVSVRVKVLCTILEETANKVRQNSFNSILTANIFCMIHSDHLPMPSHTCSG